MQKLLLFAILSSATVIQVSDSNASQLWGGHSRLNRIDVATGAILDLSMSTPAFGLRDAASDPIHDPNRIWGINGNNDLTSIDPAQDSVLTTITYDAPQPIRGLAIDPTSGKFYGTSDDSLYTIDPSNGTSSLVGLTGLGVDRALAFDNSGVLYGIANLNQLVTVDTNTGLASHVATLDVIRIEDLAARPEDGVMYALGYTTASYQLLTIDTSTGDVVLVGPSVIRPTYLAFTGIPEPSTLCILSVGAFWLILGKPREINRLS